VSVSRQLEPFSSGVLLLALFSSSLSLSSFAVPAEVTPREAWLGGYKEAGESLSSSDALERFLLSHFVQVAKPVDMTWMLRRSERNFVHNVSQVSQSEPVIIITLLFACPPLTFTRRCSLSRFWLVLCQVSVWRRVK
jgi:hypothetical protein